MGHQDIIINKVRCISCENGCCHQPTPRTEPPLSCKTLDAQRLSIKQCPYHTAAGAPSTVQQSIIHKKSPAVEKTRGDPMLLLIIPPGNPFKCHVDVLSLQLMILSVLTSPPPWVGCSESLDAFSFFFKQPIDDSQPIKRFDILSPDQIIR